MKKNLLFHIVALLAALGMVSCAKSVENELGSGQTSGSRGGLEPQAPVSQDKIDEVAFYQGTAVVKFTLEEAENIEKGLSNPVELLPAEMGVKTFERLFPHAGEYEPRTRAEGLHTYYLVNFESNFALAKAESAFQSLRGVELVERTRVKKIQKTNDPKWSNLWMFTSSRYSIHAEEAWAYTTGDPAVKVCVVDEGIQLNHEDLAWNCGSTHYNFVKYSSTISAGEHGSHVAGSIAAVGNNGKGIVGIAGGDYSKGNRGITLMSAQVFTNTSSAYNFGSAIKWGADNGAVISQNSWGNNYDYNGDGQLTGQEYTDAMNGKIDSSTKSAIDYFIKYAGCDNAGNQKADSPMKGGVVCFAAGNDGIANGVPGNYEPTISVGATSSSGALAYYSNYGSWVDICAPGSNIYSTIPTNSYGSMSGTSMACPQVSGACALLVSYFGKQGFTNEMLEDILINGAKSGLISTSNKAMGPYLDIIGSINYGNEKYGKNYPPEIVPGNLKGDLEYSQASNVSEAFTVSDPNGDKVTVTADIKGPATITARSGATNTYDFKIDMSKVTASQVGVRYAVKITAKDPEGESAVHEFSYKILENLTPTIAPGKLTGDLVYKYNQTVSESFSVADGDNDAVTVTSQIEGPATITRRSSTSNTYDFKLTCSTVPEKGNKYTVKIKATDTKGAYAEHSFTYTVLDNIPPTISAGELTGALEFHHSNVVSKTFSVADSDEDAVTVTSNIEGPATITRSGNTNNYVFALTCSKVPEAAKDYAVQITAKDAQGATATHSFTYRIKANINPVISASSLQSGMEFRNGSSIGVSKEFSVSDADNDVITVTSQIEGPATISRRSLTSDVYDFKIASLKSIDESFLDRALNVSVVAKDNFGGETVLPFTYRIKKNNNPVITTSYSGNYMFREWESVSIIFDASDPDGDEITMTHSVDSPAVIEDGEGSARFSLLCELSRDFTQKRASVIAEDNYGGKSRFDFNYQIVRTLAPVAVKDGGEYVVSGVGVDHQINIAEYFNDPNGDALHYAAKFDNSVVDVNPDIPSGMLTLKMHKPGVASVTVTADKRYLPGGFSGTASATFNVICRDAANDFDYYPNPVRTNLYIRPGSETAASMDIRITSAAGSVVYDEAGVSGSLSSPAVVDMSKCAAGSYNLYVKMNGKEYNKTVVKLPR